MAIPTLYRSDDPGAPVLNGNAGTVIAILDACLVDGYGAKPGAGWTKAFSGTNKAAYRMGAGGTADRMYLRVDDTNPVAGQRCARINAYQSMTDVDTGTDPFPTSAMLPPSNGRSAFYFFKSEANNVGTNKPWFIIATPTTFYMHYLTYAQSNDGRWNDSPSYCGSLAFGEYIYYGNPLFTKNVFVTGEQGNLPYNSGCLFQNGISPFGSVVGSLYLAADPRGLPGAVYAGKVQLRYQMRSDASNVGLGRYTGMSNPPDFLNGRFNASPIEVFVPWVLCGRMPGLYAPIVAGDMQSNDQFVPYEGAGPLAGKSLIHVFGYASQGSTGQLANLLLDLGDWG